MAKGKNNAANVTVAKPKVSGAIYWCPLSETPTIPADATTELDEKMKCLGYISEDGLTNGVDSDSTDIKGWGGVTVLKVRTSRDETFEYSLIEALSVEVLKHVYGPENVTGTLSAGVTIKHTSADLPRGVFVAEMAQTGGYVRRIVVPSGQVSNVDSVEYKADQAITYKTTLAAAPDAEGVTVYEYIAKAA